MPGDDELIVDWLSNLSTESAPVLQGPHLHIHEGEGFETGNMFSGISDGAQVSLLMVPEGDQLAHFLFATAAGGLAVWHLYEAPTITSSGTPLAVNNLNRFTRNKPSEWLAFHTPTITNVGTRLKSGIIPGTTGGTPAASASGGNVRGDSERVLHFDSAYLLVIQNQAGASVLVDISGEWYETPADAL